MRSFIFLFSILFLAACSAPGNEGTVENLPQDYDSLHKIYIEKQADLKALQKEIARIDSVMQTIGEGQNHITRLVSAEPIERKDFKHYVRVQGNIEPEDIVVVSSETGGRINSLRITEGDAVRKGQLVATIDMESVEKQKAELETQLDLAKTVYERQERLWKQDIGSEMQYLQAKNNVERLEKNIEGLETQLSKSKLYAPITGVVDEVRLKSGEMAVPGAPIATILSSSQLKVVADVPESLLGKVRTGDLVKLSFPSLQKEIEAKVTRIGRKIDPANRTISVEIDVPTMEGNLKPNLLAAVLVSDLELKDTLVVSQELIQQEVSGRKYILVVDTTTGEVPVSKKIYVETGPSYEGDVVVTKGLIGNEVIITRGARGLSVGEGLEIAKTQETTENGQD
jgi:RND family efflux transporter MFP subunit